MKPHVLIGAALFIGWMTLIAMGETTAEVRSFIGHAAVGWVSGRIMFGAYA